MRSKPTIIDHDSKSFSEKNLQQRSIVIICYLLLSILLVTCAEVHLSAATVSVTKYLSLPEEVRSIRAFSGSKAMAVTKYNLFGINLLDKKLSRLVELNKTTALFDSDVNYKNGVYAIREDKNGKEFAIIFDGDKLLEYESPGNVYKVDYCKENGIIVYHSITEDYSFRTKFTFVDNKQIDQLSNQVHGEVLVDCYQNSPGMMIGFNNENDPKTDAYYSYVTKNGEIKWQNKVDSGWLVRYLRLIDTQDKAVIIAVNRKNRSQLVVETVSLSDGKVEHKTELNNCYINDVIVSPSMVWLVIWNSNSIILYKIADNTQQYRWNNREIGHGVRDVVVNDTGRVFFLYSAREILETVSIYQINTDSKSSSIWTSNDPKYEASKKEKSMVLYNDAIYLKFSTDILLLKTQE